MQLWTAHPSTFQITDPHIVIDPTKGKFWTSPSTPNYPSALRRLHGIVGTDQIIWCDTIPGQFARTTKETDLVGWRLDVPVTQVIRILRAEPWNEIIRADGNRWSDLFVSMDDFRPAANIQALIRAPLRANSITQEEIPPAHDNDRDAKLVRRLRANGSVPRPIC